MTRWLTFLCTVSTDNMEHAKERGKVTEHMQYDADDVKLGCMGNCLCSVCEQTWKKVRERRDEPFWMVMGGERRKREHPRPGDGPTEFLISFLMPSWVPTCM